MQLEHLLALDMTTVPLQSLPSALARKLCCGRVSPKTLRVVPMTMQMHEQTQSQERKQVAVLSPV